MTDYVRSGYPRVTPRIVVPDVKGLLGFVRDVFGAQGTGEYSEHAPAEVRIGDSMILISAAGERDETHAFLYVYVPDADATHQRAVAAGARSLEAPLDTPYGDRRGMVRDAWGNTWQIATWLGR